MFNTSNNQSFGARGGGIFKNYVRGARGSFRGFGGGLFGNPQQATPNTPPAFQGQDAPPTFQSHSATPAFQSGMNQAGADGSNIPAKQTFMFSIFGDKHPNSARGNNSRGARGGRGGSNRGDFFAAGGGSPFTDFARDFQQPHNDNNDGQGASYARGSGTTGSPSFTFNHNYVRGGNTAGRGYNHGSGRGGSSSLPFANNIHGGSGGNAVGLGSGGQSFNGGSFAVNNSTDVQPPQASDCLPPAALLPVTEEDKEIFGEDIKNKLAAQKFPRGRAEPDFTPLVRGVDDIFKEDEKYSDNYAHIMDETIEMEGFPHGETLETMKSWNHPNLQKEVIDNITRAQYVAPRNIQSYSIPLALDGYDLIVQAETGSGKTAAYLIPIISMCMRDKNSGKFTSKPSLPYAIIIAPTRELVQQSYEQALKFANGTSVTVAKAYGEYFVEKNRDEIAGGCDIICVTPGRLADFVARQYIMLDEVHFLVFDESDRLLSGGFKGTIDTALFGSSSTMPIEHQTLFYSATFGSYALIQAKRYMQRKKTVVLKNKVTVPSSKCDQEFVIVRKTAKFAAVIDYLRQMFIRVQETHEKIPPTLIFCQQKLDCVKVAIGLEFKGIPALSVSGLLAQDLREKALDEFRDGTINILCVTDLLSRGLDLKDVDVVINYEMPEDMETYIHRIGRAGRIRRGKSISFVQTDADALLLCRIKKAMEKAGRVIPQSLIDAVGPHNPAQQAAADFGLKLANGIVDVRDNVVDAKKEEKAEAIVATKKEKKRVSFAEDVIENANFDDAKSEVASQQLKEEKIDKAGDSGVAAGELSAASTTPQQQEYKNVADVKNDGIAAPFVVKDVKEKVEDVNTSTPGLQEIKNVNPPENAKNNENQADSGCSLGAAAGDNDKEKPKDAAVSTTETTDEKPPEVFEAVNKNDDATPAASLEGSRPSAEENGKKKEVNASVAKDNKAEENVFDVEKMKKSLKDLGLAQAAIDAAVAAAIKTEEEKLKNASVSPKKQEKKLVDLDKKEEMGAEKVAGVAKDSDCKKADATAAQQKLPAPQDIPFGDDGWD